MADGGQSVPIYLQVGDQPRTRIGHLTAEAAAPGGRIDPAAVARLLHAAAEVVDARQAPRRRCRCRNGDEPGHQHDRGRAPRDRQTDTPRRRDT